MQVSEAVCRWSQASGLGGLFTAVLVACVMAVSYATAQEVIISKEASWVERHAAQELVGYVEKMTGERMEIVDEIAPAADEGVAFVVGTTDRPMVQALTERP